MERIVTCVLIAAALSAPIATAALQTRTVTGEVVDMECSLSRGASGRGEAHGACAMDCARRGNQLAILTDDAVYVIRGDYTANNNAKLLDFVGRRVDAGATSRTPTASARSRWPAWRRSRSQTSG